MKEIFTPICRKAPSGDSLMRVYPRYIKLSRKTVELLQLDEKSKVSFVIRNSDSIKYLYIVKKQYGYGFIKCGNGARINNTSLCQHVSAALRGYGVYRVEQEGVRDYSGDIGYRIFFKPFDK